MENEADLGRDGDADSEREVCVLVCFVHVLVATYKIWQRGGGRLRLQHIQLGH